MRAPDRRRQEPAKPPARDPAPLVRARSLFLAEEAWMDGDREERDLFLDEVEAIEEMGR